MYAAIRYIENNPGRAHLVKRAWDWQWSSAQYHVGLEKRLLHVVDIDNFINIADWKDYLNCP